MSRLRSFLFVLFPLALLAGPEALAVPGEVENLRLPDAQTLAWDAEAGADGYHVYGGDAGLLPSGGSCLHGSLTGTSVTDNGIPAAGSATFFLVAAFDSDDQGSLGQTSDGSPRIESSACVSARWLFDLAPNGPASDGVSDRVEARRNSNAWKRLSRRGEVGVWLHTGEMFCKATDLRVLGRGMSWSFARSYRSQASYDGPLGFGWDFSDNTRLHADGTDVIYYDGTGRREIFTTNGFGFDSPPGLYAKLHQNGDGSHVLRGPHGALDTFHAFDGSNLAGALDSREDRFGNRLAYLYDSQGLLTTVVDTLGRSISYSYDTEGRVDHLTDFAGRELQFSYDAAGNLSSVRSPVVVGTPNGNDFPSGKTTTYSYSSGLLDESLNHNLLTITDAKGLLYVDAVHGTAGDFLDDRVTSLQVGSSGFGGTLSFDYLALNAGADPLLADLERRQTTILDRNGNEEVHTHNAAGNRLTRNERTNREIRPGEPDHVTEFRYSEDGELLQRDLPQGNLTLYTYDNPGLDRYREGNLLEVRHVADTIASGGRGDGFGSEINDLVTVYEYDSIYNLRRSTTGPRGNDSSYIPQNGGAWSPDRYTWRSTFDYEEEDRTLNGLLDYANLWGIVLPPASPALGDIDGDGRTDQIAGRSVRYMAPEVTLDPASRQAGILGGPVQTVVTLRSYDDFGQLVRIVDPEGNHHESEYHPGDDPDGDGNATPAPLDGRSLDPSTGGYLATTLQDTTASPDRNNKTDPAPIVARTDFEYDDLGRLTGRIDGRGVSTQIYVNELDQELEIRRASATADASGSGGHPATGRGENGLVAFDFETRFFYDENDNLIKHTDEDRGNSRGLGGLITHEYDYANPLDLVVRDSVEHQTGGSLVTTFEYDANENRVRIVKSEDNVHTIEFDERDLVFQETRGESGSSGGTPATSGYNYDGNQNRNNSTDGRGHATDTIYDGFDRLVTEVDRIGDRMEIFWDPVSNPVRRITKGPTGGATPPDRSGAGNVLLSDDYFLYDELERLIRVDRTLLVPQAPLRPAPLEEGAFDPGDGFISSFFEYDSMGRRTFLVEDSNATTRYDYDGLDRMVRRESADGSFQRFTYDGNDNLVEVLEHEQSSVPGPADEEFPTTFFYDSLDRRVMTVDPVGQTNRFEYDSLDRVVTASDPQGPAGGTINRRTPGMTGVSVGINDHGNVSRFTYDGADRILTTTAVLTGSGEGDGTNAPAPDPGNPFNSDGRVITQYQWDGNGRLTSVVDDRGYTVTYRYDNLDRLVRQDNDDGTIRTWTFDENDNPLTHADENGTIQTFTWDPSDRLIRIDVNRAPGIEGSTVRTYQYDGRHRLTLGTDDNEPANGADDSEVRRVYDSLDRVIEEVQSISNGSGDKPVDFGWRAMDLPLERIYPSGRVIGRDYDAASRVISVFDPGRSEQATYDWFGMRRVLTRHFANGVRSTRLDDTGTVDIGYDGLRRTTNLRHLDTSNVLLAGFELDYDSANRLTGLRRPHDGAGPEFDGEVYRYDSIGRMVGFQEGPVAPDFTMAGVPDDEQQWTLDGAGNWVEMFRLGELFLATPNNNNEYDEMQSGGTRADDGVADDFLDPASTPAADGLNLRHDKNGNLVEQGHIELYYDGFDRVVRASRVSDGVTIARYAYDGMDRRVFRQVTNTGTFDETRHYYYAETDLIEERDEFDQPVREIVFGPHPGERLWQLHNASNGEYFLDDPLGSVVALVDLASVNLLERVTFDPFGKPTFEDPFNNPILGGGGEFLPESQQDNAELFRGLTYDPELGLRTNDPKSDLGGFFISGPVLIDPNKGRPANRAPSGRACEPFQALPSDLLDTPGPVLILRSGDPFDRCELPARDEPSVEIEILELKLESIAPIVVQPRAAPLLWAFPPVTEGPTDGPGVGFVQVDDAKIPAGFFGPAVGSAIRDPHVDPLDNAIYGLPDAIYPEPPIFDLGTTFEFDPTLPGSSGYSMTIPECVADLREKGWRHIDPLDSAIYLDIDLEAFEFDQLPFPQVDPPLFEGFEFIPPLPMDPPLLPGPIAPSSPGSLPILPPGGLDQGLELHLQGFLGGSK